MYSNGESERVIGKALRHYQIPRNKVVLMTKCGRHMSEDGDVSTKAFVPGEANKSKDYVNQGGKFALVSVYYLAVGTHSFT